MRLFLAVPVTGALGGDFLRTILSYGFDGVRVDVDERHEVAWEQARSFSRVPECFPIFLLCGGSMRRHDGKPWGANAILDHVKDECAKLRDSGLLERELAIEIGNEPDIADDYWQDRPEYLGEVYQAAIGIVSSFSTKWRTLSPSISNLNERGLKYLKKMNLLSADCIAFHRYPAGREFWDSHKGFRTRTEEVSKLREYSNGAPLWNTETGWAEFNGGYSLSECEIAGRIEDEIQFWSDAGCEALTLYQINDSATKDDPHASKDARRLSSYGFRRPDGVWKPAAKRVKKLRRAQ